MNLETASKYLRRLAGGDIKTIPDELITIALTITTNDIASRVDLPTCQMAEDTITISSGTDTYNLPVNLVNKLDRMKSIMGLFSSSKMELEPFSIEDWHFNKRYYGTASTPNRYTIWNNQILIYPSPNIGGTIYLIGLRRIEGIEDIDDKYTNLVIKGALRELYKAGSPEYLSLTGEYRYAFSKIKPQMEPVPSTWRMGDTNRSRLKQINEL